MGIEREEGSLTLPCSQGLTSLIVSVTKLEIYGAYHCIHCKIVAE